MKKPRHKIPLPVFDAEGYQTNIKDLNGTPLPDLGKVSAFTLERRRPRRRASNASGRQPVLLRLTPKTIRRLRTAARKQGKTLSEVVEERLVVA